MNNQMLDDIAGKVATGLKMAMQAKDAGKEQVQTILEQALESLDIVTEERMMVQEAMLKKAHVELIELKERVTELEAQLNQVKS
ncbi:MAG: accessory factor UbiK family protein [Mariprofundaceae bacterium]|nr:accessory factor UbiK family protein [Mariprofundaceae bacterium]